MKQLKVRLQLTLGRMRTKQRTQQREIEKELDAKEEEEKKRTQQEEGIGNSEGQKDQSVETDSGTCHEVLKQR